MTTVELAVTIMRPVDDVFAVLADVEKEPRWSENTVEEVMLTAGPMGVGSRRRAVIRGFAGRTMTNEAEIVEFDQNRRMVIRIVGTGVSAELAIDFIRTFGGTRLNWETSFRLPRLLSWAGPIFGRLYRSSMQKDLDSLKAKMESFEL